MNRFTYRILFVTFVVLNSSQLAAQKSEGFRYAIDLATADGEIYNSSLFSKSDAELVIIDFWNVGCKPCLVQLNAMAKNHAMLQEAKIRVIAVSNLPYDDASGKLVSKFEWPFEVYYDISGKLFKKLSGINSTIPLTVVYDKEWNLVKKRRGASIRYVNEKGEVIEDLELIKQTLMSGDIDRLDSPLDEYFDLITGN